MRNISILSGLMLASAASALAHAEPSWTGGKQYPAPSSPQAASGGKPSPVAASRPTFRGGKQCVVASYVRAESADADDRLILHIGSQASISHLPEPCDGLQRINNLGALRLVPKNGRYCAGDSFTVTGGMMTVVGLDSGTSHCTLGPFEQVSEMTLSEGFRR